MLEIRHKGEVRVARLKESDRLDAAIADEVRKRLVESFDKSGTKLVFDLKGIRYIDSSGFGVLLSVLKAANDNYGMFKICNVTGEVMELFKLLQFHHVFEIYDRLDPCLSSFDQ